MNRTKREGLINKYDNRIKRYPKRKLFILLQKKIVLFLLDTYLFFNQRKLKGMMLISTILIFVMTSSFSYASTEEIMQQKDLSQQMQATLENIEVEFAIEGDETTSSFLDYDIDVMAEEAYDEAVEDDEEMEDIEQYSLEDILVANEYSSVDSEEETFDKDDWRLILINKQNPVPDNYEVPLGTISGTMMCDERIIEDLLNMMKAASKDGVSLIVCSPFRDYQRQEYLFTSKVNTYISWGMSYIEAYQKAGETVTLPGASEHQIGLAIDFISANYSKLNTGFGNTAAGKWLAANCQEYGFILRYPEGKEYITGINYEPWHFRYVGIKAAKEIMENDLTLEEFLEGLE